MSSKKRAIPWRPRSGSAWRKKPPRTLKNEPRTRQLSRTAGRSQKLMPEVRLGLLAGGGRKARLPGEIRRGADQGGLDVGADPGSLRRLGAVAHRGERDPG